MNERYVKTQMYEKCTKCNGTRLVSVDYSSRKEMCPWCDHGFVPVFITEKEYEKNLHSSPEMSHSTSY